MKKFILLLIMLTTMFLIVHTSSAQEEEVLSDSLTTKIETLESENATFRTRLGELERDAQRSRGLVAQERRNIKYVFTAYAIIWILIFALIFRHFVRVKGLIQEVNMLKNLVDEQNNSQN